MAQTLPEGAVISAADMDRIVEGLVELQVGKKAHAVVKVQVDLNFHHEYPKFVTFQESSKIVNSEAEEMAFLSAVRLLDVPALPSAADLDAVAEEQKAVELTTPDVDATQFGIADTAIPTTITGTATSDDCSSSFFTDATDSADASDASEPEKL